MNAPRRDINYSQLTGRMLAGMIFVMVCFLVSGKTKVVDSESGQPLPRVSIYDRSGRMIGTGNDRGFLPEISGRSYPVRLRILGYEDFLLRTAADTTVRMSRSEYLLPEVSVDTRKRPILHLTGFIRELSTMSSVTDTVTLYREKWVDFMLPMGKEKRIEGWTSPRLLTSKSYYKFTDAWGLDSVADRSNHHFSWSDWISLPSRQNLSETIATEKIASDTLMGKYSPMEIWQRDSDRVSVQVNILAADMKGKWVPRLKSALWRDLDFEQLYMSYEYSDVGRFAVNPENIDHITCYIESMGRGHDMFRFNREYGLADAPPYVTTFMDLTIVDKEYLTVKDAKKKSKDHLGVLEETRMMFPFVEQKRDSLMLDLIARVNNIDHDGRRLAMELDTRVGNGLMPTPPGSKKQNALRGLKRVFNAGKRKYSKNPYL